MDGNGIDDPLQIMEHTYSYFQLVFTTNHDNSNWKSIKSDPLTHKCIDLSSLDKSIPPYEIRDAIFSFKPFKSPGPDGLHSFFFQKYWPIIKPFVTNLCINVFESGTLPLGTNDTYLCLIPKNFNVNNLKNLRPIGLCNTIYKVVTKIIANRLKPLLANIINPYQASFLKGRRASDNATIIQTSSKANMVLKTLLTAWNGPLSTEPFVTSNSLQRYPNLS